MPSADSRRRHERIETPLDIMIDGTLVRALDWSLSGFAVPVEALPHQDVGEMVKVGACFDLGAAILGTQFHAQVARRMEDRVGCFFVDLTDEKRGILRQIHSAHRGGRGARADTVAARVAGATATVPAELTTSTDPEAIASETAVGKSWRIRARGRPRALLAFALIAVLGLGFSAYAVSMMLQPIEARFAAVNLPGTMLSAPSDGVIEEILAKPGDALSQQSVLIRFRPRGQGPDASPQFLSSPCRCSVADLQVQTGQSVRSGEALVRLAALTGGANPQESAVIESLVPWSDAPLFGPGVAVAVRLSGETNTLPGHVIDPPAQTASALPQVVTTAARGNLATVYVTIDGPHAPLVNGQPARVRLDRSPLHLAKRLVGL